MRCELPRLPRDGLFCSQDMIRCPWCGLDMGAATVMLEDLLWAHGDGAQGLRWAPREPDGTAGPDALPTICPACGKPSIVGLPVIRGVGALRLMAVRTAADVTWLRGHAAAAWS